MVVEVTMAIDPNIPLMGRMTPIQSPLVALSDVVQTAGALSALRQRQREEAEQTAMRQVLVETGGDDEQALPRLYQTAPASARSGGRRRRMSQQPRRAQIPAEIFGWADVCARKQYSAGVNLTRPLRHERQQQIHMLRKDSQNVQDRNACGMLCSYLVVQRRNVLPLPCIWTGGRIHD